MDKYMIKFYTSHCPSCNSIKMLMDKTKIPYEEIDDEDVYMELAINHCIFEMPFADVGGELLRKDELIKYIKGQ